MDMRHSQNLSPPQNRGASSSSKKQAFTFPDGEIIEISDDEGDQINGVPGMSSQQQHAAQQSHSTVTTVAPHQLHSPTVSTCGPAEIQLLLNNREYFSEEDQVNGKNVAQHRYSPMAIDSIVAPMASGLAGPSTAGLGQPSMLGSPVKSQHAVPVAFNSTGQAINLTSPSQYLPLPPANGNRPVKRKRYDLGDFVIELTDDEDASSSPSPPPPSQHLTPAQKRVKHELPLDTLTYSSPIAAMPLGFLPQAPVLEPNPFSPQSIPGAWPGQCSDPGPSNFLNLGAPPGIPAFPAFPGANLPPADPTTENLYAQSGFRLNYDDEPVVHRIDVGVGDHAEK